jgi:apolipoprotein D and lipocalin family protein
MYADKIVMTTFEKDSYCATAFYGANDNGTLSVHNYATIGSPDGEVYIIDGFAYQSNLPEEPGQLLVDSDDASPFPAPYWILELGPENNEGLYEWAIVSDNLSLFLFVLARDVETFEAKYDAEVQAILKELGFTGQTAPIPTYQESDCVYENAKQNNVSVAPNTPDTVDALDVPAFMGLWYQMYGDKFVFETTSPGSYCATAKYWLQDDGTIGVHNYQTTDSPDGEVMTVDGYAYYKSPETAIAEPGQLMLHFDIAPSDGPYWILALGPVVDGFYDWTIVSDPMQLSLFILARDVEDFESKYEQEVVDLALSLGFTKGYNKPVPLYQGDDCVYEAVAS